MIGDFDDDLFAAPKERTVASNCTYEVKSCPKEWYKDDRLADNITDDNSQILKFRADSAYWKANYATALASYRQLLEGDVALTSQMTREVIESIGLCSLKLGESQQALQWALRLWHQSRNRDHQMCSLMLLARVYHQLKQYDNEVLAYLEQLQSHPLAVFIWASFGEALTFYWGIPFSEPMSVPKVVEAWNVKPQLLSGLSERAIRCLIGACFIRVRLIVEMGKKRGLVDNQWTHRGVLDKAEHWINGLQLSEEFQRKAAENMSQDVHMDTFHRGEEEEPEFHDLGKRNPEIGPEKDDHAAMFPTDQALFFKKWFGWMDAYMA